MSLTRWLMAALTAVGAPVIARPAHAQGKAHMQHAEDANAQRNLSADARSQTKAKDKPGHYRTDATKAISVTRTVLERRGYTVVRVERVGETRVVYYRRGNNGKGKGKGPLEKLVIRTVKERVVFEDTAPEILVDIDIKLRL